MVAKDCAASGFGRKLKSDEPMTRRRCHRAGVVEAITEDGQSVSLCERHARLAEIAYVWAGRGPARVTGLVVEVTR